MGMTDDDVQAYRRSVLGALGADDPAEVISAEADAWRRLVAEAGSDVAVRPAEGEWSVLELLGHMADAELVMAMRYRLVLAQDEPPVAGYDQDAWVAAFHGSGDDADALLALLAALQRANLDLWLATPDAARQRIGVHSERGPESYDLMFRMQAGHSRVHRAQAERALAEVRRR